MTEEVVFDPRQRLTQAILEKRSRNLKLFAEHVYPEYDFEWFHYLVMDYLERWSRKEIKKLAIFMPPQHGKSTMSSILVPAYILGRNPKAKVVTASYIKNVASKFNRYTQDLMNRVEYAQLFPKVQLPKASDDRENELQNMDYFETVGHKGFYRAVGVEGGLTSETVEFGIIDDPIKGRKEANSATYRDTLWNWYVDVWSTRLNNESCELMLFTRWHQDDVAGRLFDPTNDHYDPERASQWTILVLQALKESEPYPLPGIEQINDPRAVDQALWPRMHSAEKHLEDKRNNPFTFASLKQQRPSPLAGGLIQRAWLDVIPEAALPFNPNDPVRPTPVHYIIDGAFSEGKKDDPSAIIAYYVHNGHLYVKSCLSQKLVFDKYLAWVGPWMRQMGHGTGSRVRIEKKSSGPGLSRMLALEEYGGFSTESVSNVMVSWGKYTRGEFATPALASGKVHLIQGPWNAAFISEVTTFPNDTHDDMFDCLMYAVLTEIQGSGARKIKTSVSLNGSII